MTRILDSFLDQVRHLVTLKLNLLRHYAWVQTWDFWASFWNIVIDLQFFLVFQTFVVISAKIYLSAIVIISLRSYLQWLLFFFYRTHKRGIVNKTMRLLMIKLFLFFTRFEYFSRQFNFHYIDAVVVNIKVPELFCNGRLRTIDDFRKSSSLTLLHCVDKLRLLIFVGFSDCHQITLLTRYVMRNKSSHESLSFSFLSVRFFA